MKKRLSSTLLALCMVLTLLRGTALAAGDALKDHNVLNTVRWSFSTITNETVTRDTYSDRTQILVIFRASGECSNSNNTIRALANADWISDEDVKVIAIGVGEYREDAQTVREHVISYKERYAPDREDITFCYTAISEFWETYASLQTLINADPEYIFFSASYIFDSGGHLRFSWQGGYNSANYLKAINALRDGTDPAPGTGGDEPDPGTVPAGTVSPTDRPAVSSNINGQAYSFGRHAAPVKSYLYENGSGGLTRVEYIQGYGSSGGGQAGTVQAYIVAEEYSSGFEFQRGWSIPMELDIWGGFFAGKSYNFLVFGQKNLDEDDSKEVIRVVKYSKDWERLGQASLYGANTIIPFSFGSLRFAEYDGELYIRTCHEMYAASDGVNHQANLTMAVRESDMTMLDSYYIVMNDRAGYVSHSFNQFVIVDQQRRIVTLDHGDAHPRSVVLMVYGTKAGQGKFSGSVSSTTIQSLPGTAGDNTTGASLGGLAETSGGYVVAYNYDGKGSSDSAKNRSVYLAYVDKDSLRVTTKTLSGAGTTVPVLAAAGLNGGYILWNGTDASGRGNDTVYYAAYSDGGQVGDVRTATAPLSGCQPILYNGKVVWYTTDNSMPTLYQLDENGVTAVEGLIPTSANPFTDVSDTDYFCQSVLWAVEKNITVGTSDTTFSPGQTCTTAQILTFLWRAKGSEEVFYHPYRDVNEGDYYYHASGWAYMRGVISLDHIDYKFDPGTPCTRAMVAEYLWKLAGRPDVDVDSRFTDVPASADYAKAVAWAVQNGITKGTSDTTFSPDQVCTRGEIVTFLYRAYK